MKGLIYILFFPSGKWYIGSTWNYFSSRLGVHKADLKRGVNSNLYNHIRQIGWDCLCYEILDNVNLESRLELYKLEQEWIIRFRDENCLNQTSAYTGLDKAEYCRQKNNDPKWKDYAIKYREAHRDKQREYMKLYHLRKNQAE